jgi:cell division protein FtsZ
MMGTGESSGDRRAIEAAEAAISNPLLDDVCMKGASGLLVSITGGNDLTLYEVDEAATRIREEVDADANIILGATFDQSLDGIIRVSVVATGIDGTARQDHAPVMQNRLSAASVAGRLAVAKAFGSAQEQRTPTSYREPAPAPSIALHRDEQADHYEEEFEGDYADEHETAIDDVTIRPLAPRPSFFEPMNDEELVEDHMEEPVKPFLPPRPERAGGRSVPRMPNVNELPMPAQNQIRASRGEATEQQSLEQKRMSLLQRLAQVGIGRREPKEPDLELNHVAPKAREDVRPTAPERRSQEPVSEYARRPAGRPSVQESAARTSRNRIEEDELEIPAFLRRQVN